MAKQTKKKKKDEINVHPIKSREMSSLHLSSDSELYEQRNAREALNLEKCYFAYANCKGESTSIRFYPTIDEAYKTTLKQLTPLLSNLKTTTAYFLVCDDARYIAFEGRVTSYGLITYSFYEGVKSTLITDINNEIVKPINFNLDNMTTKKIVKKTNKKNSDKKNSGKNNEMVLSTIDQTIKDNVLDYVNAGLMTAENVDFLLKTEVEIKRIADLTEKTAMANGDVNDTQFKKAIKKASKGCIILTTKKADGNDLDKDHVSFREDGVYKETHRKTERTCPSVMKCCRVPGVVAKKNIAATIIDMYKKGREIFSTLNGDIKTDIPFVESPIVETPQVEEVKTTALPSIQSIAEAVSVSVMLRLRPTDDFTSYMMLKKTTLESDMQEFTHGLVSANINDDCVSISVLDSKSTVLKLKNNETDDVIRCVIKKMVANAIVGAMLDNHKQERIISIIDRESIQDYYNSCVMLSDFNEAA